MLPGMMTATGGVQGTLVGFKIPNRSMFRSAFEIQWDRSARLR